MEIFVFCRVCQFLILYVHASFYNLNLFHLLHYIGLIIFSSCFATDQRLIVLPSSFLLLIKPISKDTVLFRFWS